MTYKQDYLDDILIRIAYHSSGIEGNTISLPETVSIILESTLPGKHKSIREFYEIENHKQAFSLLLDSLANNAPLTVGLVQDFHALLTDRLQYDRGKLEHNGSIYRHSAMRCENEANRHMIHKLLEEELASSDDHQSFNFLHFMQKHKLKTVTDELMVIDEYFELIG